MISQSEFTSTGLSFAADSFLTAITGWCSVEGSEDFIPAYKLVQIEGAVELIPELLNAGYVKAVAASGRTYGYELIGEDERQRAKADTADEGLCEEHMSELARRIVADIEQDSAEALLTPEAADGDADEDAEDNSDSGPADAQTDTDQRPMTEDELEMGFAAFRKVYPAHVPDTDEVFDAFADVAEAEGLTRIIEAAREYAAGIDRSSRNRRPSNPRRWLETEAYLDQPVFQSGR